MRNFLVGLFLGIILATGLTAFAQLAPFDAPLEQQLNGLRQENWLRTERAIERMEYGTYSDPLLSPFNRPCP